MIAKRIRIAFVPVLVAWVAAAATAGEAEPPMAESLKSLPANKWVKLPCKAESGYGYSCPIYVPTRGQVLHWGAVEQEYQVPYSPRNDVRAFDASAGDWVSDYASDSKLGMAAQQGDKGWGGMLPSGRPAPSVIVNGVCYDSKRDRVVYTMRHLMAAYDPKVKTWQDLGAKTIMPYPVYDHDWGKGVAVMKTEIPGGPPVYGVGTCYDPENDEILLFPHFDAKNISLREATGQISGHYGTFRYSFKDNAWTLVSDTFGSDEVKAARKVLVSAMTKASAAMDAAWVLNRNPDAAKAALLRPMASEGSVALAKESAEAAKQFEVAAAEIEKLVAPAGAKTGLTPVAGLLRSAAAALSGGKAGEATKPARDALWAMNDVLDGALRVEPPARCSAPMVYDPKNKCIVMFGGFTNISRTDLSTGVNYTWLDDTWLYDVKTRQWREIAAGNRPLRPASRGRIPMVTYDPESGLVLLVTISGSLWDKTPRKAALWTLDVAKGVWAKRDEQDWPGAVEPNPADIFGLDARARLMLVMQPAKGVQTTYAMRLDLGKLPSEPAPAWTPTPPIKPYEVDLADDPAWVAKLKALPANTWVAAKPPREPSRRDWGIITVDPQRGCLVYFGGGHSSYQCNDVAVYSVGGNKWTTGVGEQNAFWPPNTWEGSTLGHRGGPATGHQRNTYQAFDGRMYVILGSDDRLPRNYVFHGEKDFVRFYDLDRGGVWRDVKIAHVEQPEKTPPDAAVQMTDPRGRIMNLSIQKDKALFRCYDLNDNKLTVREIPPPLPSGVGESRNYCYNPDRDQILWCEYSPSRDKQGAELGFKRTWAFDIKESKFIDLKPKHDLPGLPLVVEYCPAQKAAFAWLNVLRDPANQWSGAAQQWVYSFEKNDWAPLEFRGQDGIGPDCQRPYGQMVWVAKYGVFVNMCGSTRVMRPDFSQAKWE